MGVLRCPDTGLCEHVLRERLIEGNVHETIEQFGVVTIKQVPLLRMYFHATLPNAPVTPLTGFCRIQLSYSIPIEVCRDTTRRQKYNHCGVFRVKYLPAHTDMLWKLHKEANTKRRDSSTLFHFLFYFF